MKNTLNIHISISEKSKFNNLIKKLEIAKNKIKDSKSFQIIKK